MTDMTAGRAHVKYIVTKAGNLVVNGVVASVFSTSAAFWETLPFQLLDSLFQASMSYVFCHRTLPLSRFASFETIREWLDLHGC